MEHSPESLVTLPMTYGNLTGQLTKVDNKCFSSHVAVLVPTSYSRPTTITLQVTRDVRVGLVLSDSGRFSPHQSPSETFPH